MPQPCRRLSTKAVRYLREAGAKAVGRSANREAVAYFEQALALLGELPQSTETLTEELEIRIAYGPALMELKSPGSLEVETLYSRALELVEQLGIETRRFTALWGLWYMHFNRGHNSVALEAGERLLEIARKGDDSGLLLEAHHALWPTLSGMGRPLQAVLHAEQGLALYDRERHAAYTHLYAGHDPGACCRYHLAILRWITGYPDRALRDLQDALRLAEELKHPLTTVITLWFGAWVYHQRGERELAFAYWERLREVARPYGFARWVDITDMVRPLLGSDRLDIGLLAEFERQLASNQSATWRQVFFQYMIAELCAQRGYAVEGSRILFSIPESSRSAFCAPEFRRVEGELLLSKEKPAQDDAERCFNDAVLLARDRGEKSFELRAAMSLARLLARQGRRAEACSALAGIHGWFTEGFDTADLKSARELLDRLGAN